MTNLNRRTLVKTLVLASTVPPSTIRLALSQPGKPPQTPPKFDFEDVVRRARELAGAAHDILEVEFWRCLRRLSGLGQCQPDR